MLTNGLWCRSEAKYLLFTPAFHSASPCISPPVLPLAFKVSPGISPSLCNNGKRTSCPTGWTESGDSIWNSLRRMSFEFATFLRAFVAGVNLEIAKVYLVRITVNCYLLTSTSNRLIIDLDTNRCRKSTYSSPSRSWKVFIGKRSKSPDK